MTMLVEFMMSVTKILQQT